MRGINGGLDHALRTRLTDQEKEDLRTFMENQLPDEEQVQPGAGESSR
jgi:hypothetical protein